MRKTGLLVMFYPVIKAFASGLEKRSGKAIARTVVAKELAKIICYAADWDASALPMKHLGRDDDCAGARAR